MKDTDFLYASAFVHTLENNMLKPADYEALLGAASLEQAQLYLANRDYAPEKELIRIWDEVQQACPQDTPIEVFLYQNDFHNLKSILKAVVCDTAYEPLLLNPCAFSSKDLYNAVSQGKFEQLPEPMREAAAEAHSILIRENDGHRAETVLDEAYFAAIQAIALREDNAFLLDWVELNITQTKEKSAKRREYSQFISAFERQCDNELVQYLKTARQTAFGVEPVLAFLLGKQFELKNVRIILAGLRTGCSPEDIRERLRDSYA